MKRKIILFLIFISFIFSSLVFAKSPEEAFREANLSYENGDYEKAAFLYTALLKEDRVSPEVFYNLGNSFFKLKRIGKAILNYERALRLAPRDRDIKLNLKLAKSMTLDKIETPEKGFMVSMLLFPYDTMNIDELSVIVSVLFLVIIFILIFGINFIEKKAPLFYNAGALAVLMSVFLIFLVSKIHAENLTRHAVVTSEKVDVKSGPKEDYLLQFTLHQGAKVRIVEERENWYEIDLSKDLKGWLPKDTVEVI